MTTFVRALAIAVFAFLLSPLRAQDAPAPSNSTEARAILANFCDFYSKLNSFQVDYHHQYHTSGRPDDESCDCSYAFSRPTFLAITRQASPDDHTRPPIEGTFVCNGETIVGYLKSDRTYATAPVPQPPKIPMIMNMRYGTAMSGGGTFVQHLSSADISSEMNGHLLEVLFVGKETEGDILCNHLKLTYTSNTTDLWIAAEGNPLLMKSVVFHEMTFSSWMNSGPVTNHTSKNQGTTSYRNWRIDEPIPPETFSFTPPPGSKRVPQIFHFEQNGSEDPQSESH